MKIFNIITAGLLLCAGLASCEMKDELKGGSTDSSEMGYLDLGVAVNASQNSIARADDVTDGGKNENENVGVSVSADDFPVTIAGVTDASYIKEYASYSELKAENKDGVVALPVGSYTVTAHTNAELKNEMSTPYYEGVEEISITKGVTAQTHVVCTMKNMRVAMDYDDQFVASFTDWTITVTDGTTILTFECTDHEDADQLNPAPKYMLVADGVSQLTVNASGHNLQGEFVSEKRILTKPTGGNSTNWTGGDALTIKMEENTPSDPTGIQGSGITISADVSFDEEEETVEVPVTPGGGSTEEPGTGGGDEPEEPVVDAPTMVLPGTNGNITYTLNGTDMPAVANVEINAPQGIASLKVVIESGNDAFAETITQLKDSNLDFENGEEMVDNQLISQVLGQFVPGQNISAPTSGATSYSFPIHAFLSLMNIYGATAPDSHVFKMTLKDKADNTVEEELSVTINPA